MKLYNHLHVEGQFPDASVSEGTHCDSHKMSSVIVPGHGRRFKLLDQNPDHIDEDDYVDLVDIHMHVCTITQERKKNTIF